MEEVEVVTVEEVVEEVEVVTVEEVVAEVQAKTDKWAMFPIFLDYFEQLKQICRLS